MTRWLSIVVLSVFGSAAVRAADESPFFFKSGDRIVFLGDSITEQYQYSSYIEVYLTTRFPNWNLFFLNAGIGGDTANGGAGRFQSHVLDEKPTAITINFGMNDAGYGAFDANRNKVYVEKTEAMLAAAKKAGVRVALCSPNAVDRRVQERFKLYVETQKQFYAPLKGLAEKHGALFADQYGVTRAALMKMEEQKAVKVIPYYDGFHTSSSGGLLMAHAILTELKAPALVSDVNIDLAAKKADTKRCTVAGLEVGETAVSFDRTDESLPMPVQADWLSILPFVNDLKDLNHYGLTAKGLKRGIWGIHIDGKLVTKASADDLDRGINLGNLTTGPIYDQAQKVFTAIADKNRIVHGRFRGVILSNVPDWLADVAKERKPVELKKRMDQIIEKQSAVNAMAKPTKHHFELKFIQ